MTLFNAWSGEPAISFVELPPSGSYREYCRITGEHATAIGVFNADHKENVAFLEFTKHFRQKGLPVPALYAEELDRNIYLLQDLGDTTLFAHLLQMRQDGDFPPDLLTLYKQVIAQLPRFQIMAGQDLNYAVCYPRARFDQQSMLWDANYFKYYFLKLAKIPFDEQLLEDDFHRFTDYLLRTECNYFLYRDFQSRNIMLVQGAPYFIDYQGGRRGALQYDLASLLYDAKADLPPPIRLELLDDYVRTVSQYIALDPQEFRAYFYGYVLIRMMQALGAYGFRGFYERKTHFLQSIPYALKQLQWVLAHVTLPVAMPTLNAALHGVAESEELRQLSATMQTTPLHQRFFAAKPPYSPPGRGQGWVAESGSISMSRTHPCPSQEGIRHENLPLLKVAINSFAYKHGIPDDDAGHGGGYVFDCRALPNPGRYAQYAELTGKDAAVIAFLENEPEVRNFLAHVYFLVGQSIADYQRRQRPHLLVNFGCTGGRHRSVYCAEMLAKDLRAQDKLEIVLRHREQECKL